MIDEDGNVILPCEYDPAWDGIYYEQKRIVFKEGDKQGIAKAKEYAEMPKLTAELLHTFIQRIDVYKKNDKNSRNTGNPVMIYYKFQITKPEHLAIMFGLDEDDFRRADNPKPAELDFTA